MPRPKALTMRESKRVRAFQAGIEAELQDPGTFVVRLAEIHETLKQGVYQKKLTRQLAMHVNIPFDIWESLAFSYPLETQKNPAYSLFLIDKPGEVARLFSKHAEAWCHLVAYKLRLPQLRSLAFVFLTEAMDRILAQKNPSDDQLFYYVRPWVLNPKRGLTSDLLRDCYVQGWGQSFLQADATRRNWWRALNCTIENFDGESMQALQHNLHLSYKALAATEGKPWPDALSYSIWWPPMRDAYLANPLHGDRHLK